MMIHRFSLSHNILNEPSLMDLFEKSDDAGKASLDEIDNEIRLLASPLPSDLPELEVADAMIAQEMSNTSSQDLERAYFDVHGIVSNNDAAQQETPQLVNQSIRALQVQVERLDAKENAAFLQAKQQNQNYVTNREFLLLFLRAEDFDIKAAALRLARHFQVKKELFGTEKLASDITQDDLDQEAMDSLYSGLSQHLPEPDRSGRTVVVFNPNGQQRLSTISKLKRMFYNSMAFVPQSEQTQKLGGVLVLYMLGPDSKIEGRTNSEPARKNVWKLCQLMRGLPCRLSAIHFCYDSMAWSPLMVTIKMAFNAFTRIRMRSHYGSHAKCMAALQGYGIQPCFFPIKEGGIMETKHWKTWLESQRRKERRTLPRRSRIFVPGTFDVLFGKGSPLQNHTGNVKLRGLIADVKATYEKTEKGRKNEVTQAVIEIVKESSGLFLKQDGDVWIVVDDAAAQLKVSTLFRSLRGGKRSKKAEGLVASSDQSLQRMGGIDSASFPHKNSSSDPNKKF